MWLSCVSGLSYTEYDGRKVMFYNVKKYFRQCAIFWMVSMTIHWAMIIDVFKLYLTRWFRNCKDCWAYNIKERKKFLKFKTLYINQHVSIEDYHSLLAHEDTFITYLYKEHIRKNQECHISQRLHSSLVFDLSPTLRWIA